MCICGWGLCSACKIQKADILSYVMNAVETSMCYEFVSIQPCIRMCASVLFNEGGM